MEITTQQKMKQASITHKLTVVAFVLFGMLVYLCVATFIMLRFILGLHSLSAYAYIALILGFAALLISMFVYFVYSRKWLILNTKELGALCACMSIGYTLCLYTSLISIYLMPIASAAFFIAPVAKRRDAFVCSLVANIMLLIALLIEVYAGAAVALSDVIPVFTVGVLTGSLVSYNVSNDTKRLNYLIKGIIIGIAGIAAFTAYTAAAGQMQQYLSRLPYMIIAVFAQVLLGLAVQPVVEAVFNLVTNSRLVELTDRNSPLISRLMSEAPGTYSHSLSVANFAEVCAVAIGENPYLARACAYYHDVGKLSNPMYFKENQGGEINPHDELLPEVSAEIIRGHTTEGLKLCQQYKIPEEISHVTVQHHGTLPIPVFYNKAKQLTDGEVNLYDYSYHGVTPVTKIAAIIMICDSGEAAIRAMDKPDGERVDKLLKSLIDSRVEAGQFDNCDISLRDLNTVRQTMVDAFGGLYHKRMKYPGGK